MSTQKKNWAKIVLRIIKTELAKRDMTYADLEDKLVEIGIHETEANIKNKLSRGTFSAIFFLQCLRALDINTLSFDKTIFDMEKE